MVEFLEGHQLVRNCNICAEGRDMASILHMEMDVEIPNHIAWFMSCNATNVAKDSGEARLKTSLIGGVEGHILKDDVIMTGKLHVVRQDIFLDFKKHPDITKCCGI